MSYNTVADAIAATDATDATATTTATFQESEQESEYGYLYCVSNSSMPGILNIGIAWMEPELKLKNINGMPGLWYPPTVYKCEFAKKVRNVEDKRDAIYKLIAKYRINPIRKFFRISLEETRTLFDLMDGDYWDNGEESKASEVTCEVTGEANEVTGECNNWNIPWNIPMIDERFNKRKEEIKTTEKKILDCLFQKSDELLANLNRIEANLVERKMELKEINKVIEERKTELASITKESKEYYDITED